MKIQNMIHVMNIEDDPAHVMLLQRVLSQTSPLIRFSHAMNGPKAFEILLKMQAGEDLPDIILLDLNLPGLSGFDVLQEIKSRRALVSIPVVIVSSSNNPSDIEQAFHLGADDYLVKPQSYQELREGLYAVAMKFFHNELCAQVPG